MLRRAAIAAMAVSAAAAAVAVSLAASAPAASSAPAAAPAPAAATAQGAPPAKPAPAAPSAPAPGGLTTGPYQSQGTMFQFKSGADQVDAYMATPKRVGAHPAIIIVHEWWGLNDQIKTVADAFATKGYVAVVPDLYRGKVTSDPKVAAELLNALPESRAVGDLAAIFKYMQNNGAVQSNPIGSIGFCMGGHLALMLASAEPRLSACVVCYGRPETETDKLKKIEAPVFGVYGGGDTGIPQKLIDTFSADMGKLGKKVDIKVIPGAGHGFLNWNNATFTMDGAKAVWPAIDSFFAKTLPAAPTMHPRVKVKVH
jgi:carboxymethylenebutenolidase